MKTTLTFTGHIIRSFYRSGLSLIAASLMIASGCATAPKAPPPPKEYVYFPAPPEPAHAQFLCHLGGELTDFKKESSNRFLDFLVGKPAKPPQYLIKPYGLVVHEGRLYVADTMTRGVAMIDFSDGSLKWVGGSGRGALRKPVSVAFGPDNRLYVADTQRRQVIAFDQNGIYKGEYGDGTTLRPVGTIITSNELFVLDTDQSCIKVFDLATAKPVRTIGKLGNGPGEFNHPNAIAADKAGNFYICDAMNLRIQKIAPDGTSLLVFGKAGKGAGLLARPRGLAVSDDGIIYVSDGSTSTIHLFNEKGEGLMYLGYLGFNAGELYMPAQVTLSKENIPYFQKYLSPDFVSEYLVFVANNLGGNKISVFAFGHSKEKPVEPAVKQP